MKYILNIILFTFSLSAFAAGSDDHSHDHEEHGHGEDHHGYSFGSAGKPENADRIIEVIMTDNKFDLSELNISPGETIRFKIKNEGQQIHEFNIATQSMHHEHQDEMLNHISSGHMTMTDKGHGGGHDHANSLLLNPGEAGELTWTFAKADHLEFACNVPGHYQSGMLGKITVN